MIKTYKYKLRPNKTQVKTFDRWIGTCRFLYNLALEYKIMLWRDHKVSKSRFDLNYELTDLKKADGFEWIGDCPANSLLDVIARLDKAFQSFFKGGGFPKFANRDKYNSFTTWKGVHIKNNKIKIPKLGWVNLAPDNAPPENSKIKLVTIVREVGKYYACVCVEQPDLLSNKPIKGDAIGIDLGIAHFATLSDGTHIKNPAFLKSLLKKLRIEQRSLQRKKKGGANRDKQKLVVAKLFQKIRRKRQDFLHNVTTDLVSKYGTIVVEDLKLKNMTKSAKGDAENHGKNVKQKSGLNRVLLDAGFGEFVRMLEYKCEWNKRTLIKVDPKYTSQICNSCGHKSKENRESQSKFLCKNCGIEENADWNASKNILDRALAD